MSTSDLIGCIMKQPKDNQTRFKVPCGIKTNNIRAIANAPAKRQASVTNQDETPLIKSNV